MTPDQIASLIRNCDAIMEELDKMVQVNYNVEIEALNKVGGQATTSPNEHGLGIVYKLGKTSFSKVDIVVSGMSDQILHPEIGDMIRANSMKYSDLLYQKNCLFNTLMKCACGSDKKSIERTLRELELGTVSNATVAWLVRNALAAGMKAGIAIGKSQSTDEEAQSPINPPDQT
jgi:hypothetical protein